MATTAELRLTARDETQAAFNSALAGLNRLQGGVEGLQGLFSRSLGALGLGLGVQEILKQTVEAERAQARLQTVLRTTGYSAGMTAKDIDELAQSLKAASTFDDDDIKAGLIQLLRFRDIGGDTFREVAQLAVDFAAAMNTDVTSAMQTVAKSLLAPGEGMRALKEAGVQLSDSQIELAKQLSDTGHTAEAQKIVIDALKKSIGGAAAGETEGLYGSTMSLSRAWDDMLKTIGRSNLGPAVMFVNALTIGIEELNKRVDRLASSSWTERLASLVPFVDNPLWGKPTTTAAGNYGDTPGEKARFQAAAAASREAAKQQDVLAMMDRAGSSYWDDYVKRRDAAAKAAASAAAAEAKRLAAEQKRIHDEELRDAIDVMNRQLEAEEDFQRESAKAWDIYTQNVLDIRRQAIQDQAEWFGVKDLERFRQVGSGLRGWGEGAFGAQAKEIQSETEKVSDTARELGLTFQSAFEDAVISGKSFSDVLQGIEKDLIRVAARRLVTEPLVNAGSAVFSGMGEWIKGLLPGFASGGSFTVGGSGGVDSKLVAFMATPGERVSVDNGGGGAGAIVQNFTVNVSGAAAGGNAGNAQALARSIAAEVKNIIIQEMRPGGVLKR